MSTENKYQNEGGILYVIPRSIMFDKRLTQTAKLLYAMITGYTRGVKKKCFASDEHFSESLDISISMIQKTLKQLESFGYIKRKKDNDGRYITITWKM